MYFYSGGYQTIYLFGSILKVAKVLYSVWAVILMRLVHNFWVVRQRRGDALF